MRVKRVIAIVTRFEVQLFGIVCILSRHIKHAANAWHVIYRSTSIIYCRIQCHIMARTSQKACKSTGGKAPRKQLFDEGGHDTGVSSPAADIEMSSDVQPPTGQVHQNQASFNTHTHIYSTLIDLGRTTVTSA